MNAPISTTSPEAAVAEVLLTNPAHVFLLKGLPETLDELATLMRTCIALGYRIAVENATAEEDDGHITNHPYIDWFAADKRLQEVLAKTSGT
jgi:hypothetical protein